MPSIVTSVETKGPLFSAQGQRIFRQTASGLMREMVDLGMARLSQMLRPRPAGIYLSVSQARPGQASTGNYRRHLHQWQRELHAFIGDGGVVYGPWLEGTSSRNQVSRFKGYASFRRTAQWMQAQVPRLAKKHAVWIARGLGG